MTPIVSLSATADGDAVDVIHHDINRSLGGKLEWDAADAHGTSRWYYVRSTLVTDNAHLIGGCLAKETAAGDNFNDRITTYTDGTAIADADDVRMVYIEHLGLNLLGEASYANDILYIYLDGGNKSNADALCLEAGESIILKFKKQNGVDIDNLHVDMHQNTAQVKVIALCDDGA